MKIAKTRSRKQLFFAAVVMLSALTNFSAHAGTSDHGGDNTIQRILLARHYALEILSASADARLNAQTRSTMMAVVQSQPIFSRERVQMLNNTGQRVEVDAKYDDTQDLITFNLPRIQERNSPVYELTMLYLHEAGHAVGLSKDMAQNFKDFHNDIGYRLLLDGVNASKTSLPDNIFRPVQLLDRNIRCDIELYGRDGVRVRRQVLRYAEEWQRNSIVFSEDILVDGEAINVHIYFTSKFASTNIYHASSDFYLNSDVYVNGGESFGVMLRNPASTGPLRSVGIKCRMEE